MRSTFTAARLHAHNPGPMTGSGNHTYVVSAGGSAILIDAGVGHPEHLATLQTELTATGAELAAVLVTHAHSDHSSGVEAIAAEWPAARFFKYPWPQEDAKRRVEWQDVRQGDRFPLGRSSEDALIALHMPGHSPDHVVFWHEQSRTAFTGDLVVADNTVVIPASRGGNLRDYLASLERLLALQPERLLPAHGSEIYDPERLIRGYIRHRLIREAQVLEALAAGRGTVTAIAESIYHGLASALMPAAHETVLAHLEKLRQERRAVDEDGRWRRLPI